MEAHLGQALSLIPAFDLLRRPARVALGCAAVLMLCSAPAFSQEAAPGLGAEEADSSAIALELIGTGQSAPAEALLRRLMVRAAAEHGDSSLQVAHVLDMLVNCLWRAGKSQAEETRELAHFCVALKEDHFGPDHAEVARSLFSLGVMRAMGGDLSRADSIFARVLEIQERHLPPDHEDLATTINALANMRHMRSDYVGALPLYRRSMKMAEDAGGPLAKRAISVRGNVSNALIELGNYRAARSLLERQIDLLVAAEMRVEDLAFAYALMGKIAHQIGDYEKALEFRNLSLDVRREVHPANHPRIATTLFNIGTLLWRLGRTGEGRPLIEEALGMWDALYGPDHAHSAAFYEVLGRIAFAEGNLSESRQMHTRALRIREAMIGNEAPKVAETLQSLGRIALEEGRYADAGAHLSRAIEIVTAALGADHHWVASYESDLAQVDFCRGDYAGAMRHALSAEHKRAHYLRLTLRALPERQALRAAALSRQVAGLGLLLSLPESLRIGRLVEDAWDALIHSRAIVFDEMAARNRRGHGGGRGEDDSLLVAYQQASTRLANLHVRGPGDADPEAYQQVMAAAREAMEGAEWKLAERGLSLQPMAMGRDLGWEDVRGALPEDAALLAYVRFPRYIAKDAQGTRTVPAYGAFILSAAARAARFVDLGDASSIDALIAAWKREAGTGALRADRDPAAAERAYAKAGEALRRVLWDPLQEHLAAPRELFTVADGQIHLVNLAALPDGEGGYLVESDPALRHFSTEREIAQRGVPLPTGEGVLVLGAPDFDWDGERAALGGDEEIQEASFRGGRPECGELRDYRFGPLPGSLIEARAVADLWRKKEPRVRLLTGSAASERAVKALTAGCRSLHIATHGYFISGFCPSGLEATRGIGLLVPEEDEHAASGVALPRELHNPLLLSGLALAGANKRNQAGAGDEDGILTAQEIAALDLSSVRWAVLSACDTGSGEVMSGEGVLGLQRAFRVAGAHTLITSLWAVQDAATRRWMQAFYRASLEEGLAAHAAVRQASLSALREMRRSGETSHPFYWGAFLASGERR